MSKHVRRSIVSVFLIALCLVGPLAAQSSPASTPDQLATLHGVLRSEADPSQKLDACKKLAAVGTAESVPVLAKLLADPQLSHAARIALEAIPDAAAGEALRSAIPTLEGPLLLGVVNSLGARRDAAAVPALRDLLRSGDAIVAMGAAHALGRIATDTAAAALIEAMPNAAPSLQVALGQGMLLAADESRRSGRPEMAQELCQQIAQMQLPRHIRLSAARGILLSSEPMDKTLFTALLHDDQEAAFATALTVVRELPSNAVTGVIAEVLKQLPAERQVLLVAALADRCDDTALPLVLAAGNSPSAQVREAATRCLANFHYASAGPQLLALACNPQEPGSAAAREALILMADPAADAAILQQLEHADTRARTVLFQLIGGRHIVAGVPSLVQGADAQDRQERLAALDALGKTVPANQLGILTARLVSVAPAEEIEAVKTALVASCVRLGDTETCAKEVVACLPKTTGALQLQLYEVLRLIGGPTALQAVAEAAKNPDPQFQDTITRVLGEWMTPDAAPLLLDLAQSDMPDTYRHRALRGYIRILRQFDMTNRQRIEMCGKAMPLAQRKEERLLMLEALLRIPSTETLSLALTQLDAEEVGHRACEVTLSLSEELVELRPAAVMAAMEKVLTTTQDATLRGYAQGLLDRARQKQTP